MKKLLTLSVVLLTSVSIYAQTAVYDSVIMGAGYANQVWYNMTSGEVSQTPNNNWDLAFTTYFMGASAYINSAQGVALYAIPNTDISGFATVIDTTGYEGWQSLNNSDTTWNKGAFNQNMGNFPNYGWGTYDNVTHEVTGDSLFLVRTGMNPNYEFKKLWVIKKDVSGNWIIRSANIDNSNDVTDTILYSSYSGKNFSYYSLSNQSDLNREPLTTDWDITFARYTANVLTTSCIPATGYFSVTGVLQNKKVVAAQADGEDFSTVDFASYQSQLDSNISTIGFDWKCSGVLTANVVYFIKSNSAEIWKVQFTEPAPTGATGKIFFMKESLATGISPLNETINSISVYPNPATGNASLIVDAKKSGTASFSIFNTVGALIDNQSTYLKQGMNVIAINTESLANGIYFINNSNEKNSEVLKLIIAR